MKLLGALFVNITGFQVSKCQQCGTGSEKDIPRVAKRN